MRSVRILGIAAVCLMAACAKGEKSAADSAANASAASTPAAGSAGASTAAASGCLLGTWKKQDGDFTQTFTFNQDGTGEEVQSRSDTRTFKWTMKNENTVHITYTTQGAANTEWDLNVNCASNKFASLYSK